MARILRRRGVDVRVFTHEPDPRRRTALRVVDEPVDEVPVTRLTFFDGLVPNNALNDYYNVFIGKMFGEWLDEHKPDVVHAFHLMGLGLSLVEECRARGIPVYVQMMDFWFLCPTVQLLRHDGALCAGPDTNVCIECLSTDNFGYLSLRMFAKREGFVESPDPEPSLSELNHADVGLRREALHSRKDFIRRMLDQATGLVAPSRFIKRLFLDHGYRDEHMRYVPYGVEPLPGVSRKVPIHGDESITFGFLGSVNPQKGLEVLISAFREYRSNRFRLVVRGNMQHFPKYAKRVRAFASLDPRINFMGPFAHDELPGVLSSIDVLVVPSVWYENTPFVVLEAFGSGRPVVASDLGGLSELVDEGVNGKRFRAGDPGDLLNVLKQFDEDPQLLSRLAGGIQKVRTLEENADDFVALWEARMSAAGGVA
jgi:glycosyltransferase involved in cell wall biosynthesis